MHIFPRSPITHHPPTPSPNLQDQTNHPAFLLDNCALLFPQEINLTIITTPETDYIISLPNPPPSTPTSTQTSIQASAPKILLDAPASDLELLYQKTQQRTAEFLRGMQSSVPFAGMRGRRSENRDSGRGVDLASREMERRRDRDRDSHNGRDLGGMDKEDFQKAVAIGNFKMIQKSRNRDYTAASEDSNIEERSGESIQLPQQYPQQQQPQLQLPSDNIRRSYTTPNPPNPLNPPHSLQPSPTSTISSTTTLNPSTNPNIYHTSPKPKIPLPFPTIPTIPSKVPFALHLQTAKPPTTRSQPLYAANHRRTCCEHEKQRRRDAEAKVRILEEEIEGLRRLVLKGAAGGGVLSILDGDDEEGRLMEEHEKDGVKGDGDMERRRRSIMERELQRGRESGSGKDKRERGRDWGRDMDTEDDEEEQFEVLEYLDDRGL
ncbi:hypothetical protein BZA77DRAFT_311564 [Pyronema omphalodes]|nr:hypothetical protein BZA77DRAFT_311564 [Pyronema omphalodes]